MTGNRNTEESKNETVFSLDFIEKLRRRWERRPKYEHPPLFRLATRPEWAEEREKVEALVSLVPQSTQPTAIKLLRNPNHFLTTFNTLVIGDQLRRCGLDLEYEKLIDGQAPDWNVRSEYGIAELTVEVTTLFAPEWFQKLTRVWQEFVGRMETIELNYNVLLTCPNTEALVSKSLKPIVGFVRNQLRAIADPTPGTIYEFVYNEEDLRIAFDAVAREQEAGGHVQVPLSPFLMQWVNVEYLRETISKKLTKYKFAKKSQVPLLVAVVPLFDSSIELDNLVEIMFSSYRTDEGGALMVKRDKLGPLALNTRLSAVIIVENAWNPRTKIVHNPLAANPVPAGLFRGLRNLVVEDETEGYFKMQWIVPR